MVFLPYPFMLYKMSVAMTAIPTRRSVAQRRLTQRVQIPRLAQENETQNETAGLCFT